jgi:hypothetical protein
MTTKSEMSAAGVYEIRMVPTGRLGPVSKLFHKVASILGGHPTPGDTHPVIFEKATGEKAVPVTGTGTFLHEHIQADLQRLSAADFRKRYLAS